MGQSLSQNYIHLVFGTKGRAHFISSEIENQLHAYIGGALKAHESTGLVINSMPDHIHILFKLSRNYALAKVVEEIKKSSSKWMKEEGVSNFAWQNGYGAFSVGSSAVEPVKKYIQNQKEHHRIKSFREEMEDLIEEYGLQEYQPEFFWK